MSQGQHWADKRAAKIARMHRLVGANEFETAEQIAEAMKVPLRTIRKLLAEIRHPESGFYPIGRFNGIYRSAKTHPELFESYEQHTRSVVKGIDQQRVNMARTAEGEFPKQHKRIIASLEDSEFERAKLTAYIQTFREIAQDFPEPAVQRLRDRFMHNLGLARGAT